MKRITSLAIAFTFAIALGACSSSPTDVTIGSDNVTIGSDNVTIGSDNVTIGSDNASGGSGS